MASYIFWVGCQCFHNTQDEDCTKEPQGNFFFNEKIEYGDVKRVFLTAQAHLHQQVPAPSRPLPNPPYPSINQLVKDPIHNRK
jgi:hypothetical protein